MFNNRNNFLNPPFVGRPFAIAKIFGNDENENLKGTVKFFNSKLGVFVLSEIHNLPETETNFFGMHIHENGECTGNFDSAGGHFGTGPHPTHAGDIPPLLSANGTALSLVLTNRFNPNEIIGKSVIIHQSPDDFTTQPSGNSGARIGCGVIEKI